MEQKEKSLSKQIDFFLMYKHYQKSESEDPLASQNPRENTVVIDSFTIDFLSKIHENKTKYTCTKLN